MNTHFCFSERLILREKKIRGFSFGPLEYQKKLQIFKKHHAGELHKKRHNFAPGAANYTFF